MHCTNNISKDCDDDATNNISIDDDDDDEVKAVDEEKDYQYLCSQDTSDTIYNLNNSRSLSFNSWVLVS